MIFYVHHSYGGSLEVDKYIDDSGIYIWCFLFIYEWRKALYKNNFFEYLFYIFEKWEKKNTLKKLYCGMKRS